MTYTVRHGSVPCRAIMVFRTLPTGASLTCVELGIALRVRHAELKARLADAVDAGYLAFDGTYSLGPMNAGTFSSQVRGRGPCKTQRPEGPRDKVAARAYRGSLRELMMSGMSIEVGDPLRELAVVLETARTVHAAKAMSRFKGSEVDAAIAREIRSVTQAMAQATSMLNQYLEVMTS